MNRLVYLHHYTILHKNTPLYICAHIPKRAARPTAVIFCASFMHEYYNSSNILIKLADSFASVGITVFRFAYRGTDYCDEQWEDFTIVDYREDICFMVKHVHEMNIFENIGLYGIRLGATLALLTVQDSKVPIDFCITDEPVASGYDLYKEIIYHYILSLKAEANQLQIITKRKIDKLLSTGEKFQIEGFNLTNQMVDSLICVNLEKISTDFKIPCLCRSLLKSKSFGISFLKNHLSECRSVDFDYTLILAGPIWRYHILGIDNKTFFGTIQSWLEKRPFLIKKQQYLIPESHVYATMKKFIDTDNTLTKVITYKLSTGEEIVGTVMLPAKNTLTYPSVSIFPSGYMPRIFVYQLRKSYVQALLSFGIPVIFIDLPGVGESPGELPIKDEFKNIFIESHRKKITGVLDSVSQKIAETFNSQNIILWGNCHTALYCLFTAAYNKNITHLILIGMPLGGNISWKYYFDKIIAKSKLRLVHLLQKLFKIKLENKTNDLHKAKYSRHKLIIDTIHIICKAKNQTVLSLFGSLDPYFDSKFWELFRKKLKRKHKSNDRWEVFVDNNGNHLLSSPESQSLVQTKVRDLLNRKLHHETTF